MYCSGLTMLIPSDFLRNPKLGLLILSSSTFQSESLAYNWDNILVSIFFAWINIEFNDFPNLKHLLIIEELAQQYKFETPILVTDGLFMINVVFNVLHATHIWDFGPLLIHVGMTREPLSRIPISWLNITLLDWPH